MRALGEIVVFTAGGEAYRWEDVLLAAMAWGDWLELEAQVREGLACAMRLAEGRDDLDRNLVNAAADEFRYERDLITAEETTTWLARWGLTPNAWMEYIERSVLRQACGDDLAQVVHQYAATDADVAAAVGAEGICSGAFTRFARKLAGRVAAYERIRVQPPVSPPAEGRHVPQAYPFVEPRRIAASARRLLGIAGETCGERLENLARLEEGYRIFAAQVLTPKAIRDAVAAHHLDWIEIISHTASFQQEPAAREAALCVREDREALADVAQLAGTSAREVRFYLEDVDPAGREFFLGARPGDLIGPLTSNGAFALFEVVGKILPSPAAAGVRERAKRSSLERAVEHEITHRVHWQFPM